MVGWPVEQYDDACEFVKHQRHAERQEDLVQRRPVVDGANEPDFEDTAERGERAEGHDDGEAEREQSSGGAARLCHRHDEHEAAEVGTEHRERAVREVEDAHQAEHERQPGGDHHVEARLRQTTDDHLAERGGRELDERVDELQRERRERRQRRQERNDGAHAERYLRRRSPSALTSAVSPSSTTRPWSRT